MPPTTTTTTAAPPPVTVPRTLPLVSVLDQGAKGDGTTDDTAAFQAALNNAGQATVGRLDVPPGTYLVGPLTVPSDVLLVGAGAGAVLRRAPGATGPLLQASGTHITIQSLRLDLGGIQVLQASTRVRVVDCEITTPDVALVSAGTGVIISGNVITNSSTDAIAVSGPQTSIVGNRISGSGSAAVRVTGDGTTTSATTVMGNDITIPAGHGPAGIVVDGSVGVSVTDNRVSGSTSSAGGLGIGVTSDTAAASGITITGNEVASIGADGVLVQQAQQVTLSGNVVSGCLGRGIVVGGGSSAAAVDTNTVTGCGATGIDVSGSTDLVVTSNVCTNNTGAGITLGGPNGTLRTVMADNVCTAQTTGITGTGALTAVVLSGNQVGGNSGAGLSLTGATLGGGTTSLPYRRIRSVTVGTSATPVAHGLGYAPLSLAITPTTAGSVWQAAPSDATNVYLQAATQGVGCELIVG
jgi:parallel beta-helix repeat protein